MVRFALVVVVLALGACSKKHVDPAAAPGTFGAACSADAECASGACFPDNAGGYCSLRCSGDEGCAGVGAHHCNKKGYCKR